MAATTCAAGCALQSAVLTLIDAATAKYKTAPQPVVTQPLGHFSDLNFLPAWATRKQTQIRNGWIWAESASSAGGG